MYAPIINLDTYVFYLMEQCKKTETQINSHINSIKQQETTQILYLPKYSEENNESIVFLDRVSYCPIDAIPTNEITQRRLFTLSDYGAYYLLYKIALNFSRLTDGVVRKSND